MPTNKSNKSNDSIKSNKAAPQKTEQVGKTAGKSDSTGSKKGRA